MILVSKVVPETGRGRRRLDFLVVLLDQNTIDGNKFVFDFLVLRLRTPVYKNIFMFNGNIENTASNEKNANILYGSCYTSNSLLMILDKK